MKKSLHFLIVDGYPKKSRNEFKKAGMKFAGILYAEMLNKYLPDATYDLIYSSDPGTVLPDKKGLKKYSGLLWPGCNLTIYNTKDDRVKRMIDLCRNAYTVGLPQFGSCWGIQLAAYIPGGEVKANPLGREMGIGRKIRLTRKGTKHPMMKGKPEVYSHFLSHDDEVTSLPRGAVLLGGNDYSDVQAIAVKYKRGTFWATQYHPEYDLHEMAKLIVAREKKLIELGFFKNNSEMKRYVKQLELLYKEPHRKYLRWKLGIDDDVLSDSVRQCEFINWIDTIILKKNKRLFK
ncbi:type 1 glutamine amidotransferase [Spirochaetota bacterium]